MRFECGPEPSVYMKGFLPNFAIFHFYTQKIEYMGGKKVVRNRGIAKPVVINSGRQIQTFHGFVILNNPIILALVCIDAP